MSTDWFSARVLHQFGFYPLLAATRRAIGRLQRWRQVDGGDLGSQGERLAAKYLRRRGLTILARRVRLVWGEIDLIAVEHDVIVFVEVKTRRAGQLEAAFAAVDAEKQRRLIRLALAYLRRHHLEGYPVRFDVVAIAWSPELGPPDIQHVRHAFVAPPDLA